MNSIIFILLCGLDFLVFSWVSQWLLFSTLVCYLTALLVTDYYDQFSFSSVVPLCLLLLEDCFLYGRFGLILLFLLPVMYVAKEVKYAFRYAFWLFFPLFFTARL